MPAATIRKELVLEWRTRLPMEYLVEPRLGKIEGHEFGLRPCQGDFIVMTDDDVLPDRNWLLEWRACRGLAFPPPPDVPSLAARSHRSSIPTGLQVMFQNGAMALCMAPAPIVQRAK